MLPSAVVLVLLLGSTSTFITSRTNAAPISIANGAVKASDGCNNDQTCGPTFCARVSNPSCCISTGNYPPSGGSCPAEQNRGKVDVNSIQCKQCEVPTNNPNCTPEALQKILSMGPGVKAAYCNDQFLVVHSDDTPGHPTYLDKIQRPPGSSKSGANYDSQCVTRNFTAQWLAFKIPLNPVALSTSSPTVNNLNNFPSPSDSLVGIPLPKSGPVGMMIDAQPLFPPFNDRSEYTWKSCEMDGCNAHVGQGFDYHYHGDPFGGSTTSCVYSAANYSSSTVHPPLIGYSLDGYSIYGRHIDTENLGQSTPLDDCGGHTHTGVEGYHYHAQLFVVPAGQAQRQLAGATPKQPRPGATPKQPRPGAKVLRPKPSPIPSPVQPSPSPSPVQPSPSPSPVQPSPQPSGGGLPQGSYVAYVAGPHKCWKADISKIANFWMSSNGPSATAAYGVGGPITNRVDYEQLRPCCVSSG